MIRFQSPLPSNYDQIVEIFTRQDEQPTATALGQSIMKLTPISTSLATSLASPSPSPVAPTLLPTSLATSPTPLASLPPPPPQLATIPEESDTKTVRVTFPGPDEMKAYRRSTGGFALAVDPFVVKPPVVAAQDPTQLKEANPNLTDEYLKQREDLKAQRDAATLIKEVTVMESPPTNVPIDFMEEQRRQFDEQQAALRLARAQLATPESKLEKEQELELPPANAQPSIKRTILIPNIGTEKKAHADTEQPIPAPQRQIESLRLDELRQLCVSRGISSKGNKPDLIARLKAVGIMVTV